MMSWMTEKVRIDGFSRLHLSAITHSLDTTHLAPHFEEKPFPNGSHDCDEDATQQHDQWRPEHVQVHRLWLVELKLTKLHQFAELRHIPTSSVVEPFIFHSLNKTFFDHLQRTDVKGIYKWLIKVLPVRHAVGLFSKGFSGGGEITGLLVYAVAGECWLHDEGVILIIATTLQAICSATH